MLPLSVIFLLVLVPLLMLLLHLTRWKRAPQWLMVVIGMLLVWSLVIVTYFHIPQMTSYLSWEPKLLFPLSPVLLTDQVSWTFSIALVTIGLALGLTAVARVERSSLPYNQQPIPEQGNVSTQIANGNWQAWAGCLLIIGMGVVSVQSGNMLTMLLSWAAIDVIELIIRLVQINGSEGKRYSILAFSIRTTGTIVLILAQIQVWQTGRISNLSSISPQSAVYLLLAAGLHLGVLPVHLPTLQEIQFRRSLGTVLDFVPLAAGLSLLVRAAATVGIEQSIATYALILCALTALLGAGLWVYAADELSGRPFWILGTASFATASAIVGKPEACLSWGAASIFVGGFLSFYSLRHPRIRYLAVLGFLSLSAIPFTPNWAGILFYTNLGENLSGWQSTFFYITFIVAHSLLLAGFLRHAMRSSVLSGDNVRDPQVERWIWLVYPIGLVVLPITHIIVGLWSLPDYKNLPISTYFYGLAASVLCISFLYVNRSLQSSTIAIPALSSRQIPSKYLSFTWLYQPIWYFYNRIQRLSRLVNSLLEGDGGILWAIVLFFFILVFMKR